jgi:hypothetical protein
MLREKLVVATVLMLALGYHGSWTGVQASCQTIATKDEWIRCKWCLRDMGGWGWLEECIAISILREKSVDATALMVALRHHGSLTGVQAFCQIEIFHMMS